MRKRSGCMAPAGDERETPASPAGQDHLQPAAAAAAAVYAATEKKKVRAADEADGGCGGEPAPRRAAAGEESARERLKRHRTEMAGRVRVPEMWGQERLLKDWVDCSAFDRPLAATRGLLTARDALVAECAAAPRRPPLAPTARPLRVQNGCS